MIDRPARVERGRRGRPLADPLRSDVRLLTTLLGDAIRSDGGGALFARVETLRRATIAFHEHASAGRLRAVERIVASLDPSEAAAVTRAFTVFFQLVNVAEDHHRVRELRARESTSPLTLPSGLEVTEVLTAHPTEAKRRAVLEHLWRIGDLLDDADDPRAGAGDRRETRRRLAEEVEGLWLTDPVRLRTPTPLDEVRATLALFDRTIFSVAPAVYRAAAAETTGPAFLRWATWVGGDADGNPGVTASVTRKAAEAARDHALLGYETATRRIARGLSVSATTVPASPALRRALDADGRRFPTRANELRRTLPDAPHRRALVLIGERVRATRLDQTGGYRRPSEFLRDIERVRASLDAAGALRLADGDLLDLIRQIETFGFHLASIELRHHSSSVRDGAPQVIAALRAMADIQRRLGPEACHTLVVSFTRDARDLAAAYELARLVDPALPARLDVVPLLESRRELDGARGILDDALGIPAVRLRLRANGRRMQVMLGYSDSTKETGVLSATFALYETQRRLVAWAHERDVTLTLFHGRGGALGRGGGPTARAIAGQPPGSVDGRFKVTEQGEVAFTRYGDRTIARHHLEQIARAAASAPGRGAPDPFDRFVDEVRAIADASESAWRGLLSTPGFARFFTQVTPIRQIASLPIASRPVSRTSTVEDLDALRAIPWVFAWSQARINLPGWYGVGTGLDAVASRRGGLARLRRMHRTWPFFASVVENAELSVAKANRELAARYLERGERPDLAASILDEWDRTEHLLLGVTGHDRLLGGRPGLAEAIDLRSPYIDALSALQLRVLDDPASRRVAQATIAGIAAGLQNTG